MGNRSTRVISTEEACALLGREAEKKFEEAFVALCKRPRGVVPMDEATFTTEILGVYPEMPKMFSSRLFTAFDTNGSGDLDAEEFLCGVAILTCGKLEHKLRFAFHVYEHDREGVIRSGDLVHAYIAIHNSKRYTVAHAEKAVANLVAAMECKRRDQITLEEWMAWGRSNPEDPLLLTIVFGMKDAFVSDALNGYLESKLDPTAIRRQLAGSSLFTETEVALVQASYSDMKMASPSGLVDSDAVQSMLGRFLPPRVVQRLYCRWDVGSAGVVSCDAMLMTLSICCNGSVDEKAKLAFELFDPELTGVLTPEAVEELVGAALWTELSLSLVDNGLNRQGLVSMLAARNVEVAAKLDSHVADLYDSLKLPLRSPIDFTVYSAWVGKHPSVLNFLDVLQQVARIEMGIRPPTLREEAALIQSVFKEFDPIKPGCVGDTWYVLQYDWWKQWSHQSGFDGSSNRGGAGDRDPAVVLPPIDNRSIVVRNGPGATVGMLRENLYRDQDYKLLTPRAWTALSKWYDGRTPISRKVIDITAPSSPALAEDSSVSVKKTKLSDFVAGASTRHVAKLELELYPVLLTIRRMNKEGQLGQFNVPLLFSRMDTLQHMRSRACQSYFLSDPNATRMWYRPEPTVSWRPLRDLNTTVDTEQMVDYGEILLESQQPDGSWLLHGFRGDDIISTPSSRPALAHQESHRPRGLVGLFNLGNTCYLNSALQCLSNSPLITDYFLRGEHVFDINTVSKMGTGGQLAVDYGELMQEMWSTDASLSAVQPKRLKAAIGKFKPQFENNEQQDAQELLTVLLEGLGEDLNRVKKKPYIQNADSNGRPDPVVAEEWWVSHLARERSIVTLFQGQYKSAIRCLNCGNESCSFEPFSLLQLPLPEPLHRFVRVTVVFRGGVRRPLVLSVKVQKTGTLADVKAAVERSRPGSFLATPDTATIHVHAADLVAAKVSQHLLLDSSLPNDTPLSTVRESDGLYLYQVPPVELFTPRATKPVPMQNNTLVTAVWSGNGRTYPGVITKVNSDGTYRVHFNDGDIDDRVPPENVFARDLPVYDVCVIQRLFAQASRFTICPFRPTTIGQPFVLRLQPDTLSGADLYAEIVTNVQRFIRTPLPASASIAASRSTLSSASMGAIDTAMDSDDSDAPRSTVSAGSLKRRKLSREERMQKEIRTMRQWGFVLRTVDRAGDVCLRCPWYAKCVGCPLFPDAPKGQSWNDGYIAIDWDPFIWLDAFDRTEASKEDLHPSVEANRALEDQPIQLSTCLDVFNHSERLTDHYCSKCSRAANGEDILLRTMTKKMDLYRLPPLLVIQLKRFQFNQFSRRKLYNLVMFPVQGLDLKNYLSRDPPTGSPVDLSIWQYLGGRLEDGAANYDDSRDMVDEATPIGPPVGSREARYEGIPLTVSRDQTTYDLYGVVNHHGALGAGHYTAYCKSSTTGRWHCFNDRVVSDLDDVTVQSSNAYLLFYVRRDMADEDVTRVFPRTNHEPVDISKMTAKYQAATGKTCTIM